LEGQLELFLLYDHDKDVHPANADAVREAWQGTSFIPSSSPTHHLWLACLHGPSHLAFVQWLNAPGQTSVIRSLAPRELLVLPTRTQLAPDFPHATRAARGRTTVAHGVTSSRSVKRSMMDRSDDFEAEGALWNYLYRGDAQVESATLASGALVYGHRRDAALGGYAIDWRPPRPEVLVEWNRKLVGRLVRLIQMGWGYRALTELFHDRQETRFGSSQPHDLTERRAVGCVDDFPRSLRFSNARAEGILADPAPGHAYEFSHAGPTRGALAKTIQEQSFQLALICAWTAARRGWSEGALASMLRDAGSQWATQLGRPLSNWEEKLPMSLETAAREAIFGMLNLQGGIDLGHPNGPISVPAMVAFSETVARCTVEAMSDSSRRTE
jgi:hypothetical protein